MASCKAKIIEKIFHWRTLHSGDTMEHVKRRFKSQKTFSIIKSFYKIANVQLKEINGHKCYVIIPKNASTKKCMYIHGGGFVTQITPFHWFFIKRLLLATKATFYVPDYPLSTDTYASAKDAVTMLLETYKLMLIDTKPENITVMGDSAGGTLTLVLAQQAKLNGLPAPKNLIPLSPALDLEIDIAKSYEYASRDSVLTQGLLYCASKWYIPAGEDAKNPIYSPIYGDFKDIGFITMFMGTHESLLLQSDILDKKLTAEHIDHKYFVGQDMFHVWMLFTIKERKEPIDLIINLIRD